MTQANPAPAKDGQVVFFIDQEKFTKEDSSFTVRELLEMAGEDPAETTLVLRHGNETTEYTNLDQVVEVTNGTHFVVFHNGPTPVS
ncbi:MAG: hypothetical protein ACLGIK_15360 [Gemmatimonadota bacterium]